METYTPWDAADYLETPQDIAAYLNEVLQIGDPKLLQAALGDVSRSQGMSKIAAQAGVGRESLYKSLSTEGNPSWKTIMNVLSALGLSLEIKIPA